MNGARSDLGEDEFEDEDLRIFNQACAEGGGVGGENNLSEAEV